MVAQARVAHLLIVAMAGLLLGLAIFSIGRTIPAPHRTTPVYDPPVLAGQWIPGYCSAGVYARLGDTIVLTTSPHCGGDGTRATSPDGTVQGVLGPTAVITDCPHPDHTCKASDMNYLVVEPDRVPWGHLNEIDLGIGGYRILAPDTKPLSCGDIAVGDPIEMDGRGAYRTGTVAEKGEYLHPAGEDGDFFPCLVASRLQVGTGDSGSVVLVRGVPAGIVSRSLDGNLGFTPLAEGLAALGLDLCTTPDCGLEPPAVTGPRPWPHSRVIQATLPFMDAPIDDDTFEGWVVEAINALPPQFRERLGSVAIIIEDWATPEQLAATHAQGLYGLYSGVPRSRLGADWVTTPSRITIYRGQLEAHFRTPESLRTKVIDTVHHEIAHHFGISDDRLRELARERGAR